MFASMRITSLWLALSLLLMSSVQAEDHPFRVVVSIKPIHSILSALMAGGDDPVLLVTGDQKPWSYTLTEQQRQQLQDADLLIWTGAELESFLVQPLSRLPASVKVVELLKDSAIKVLPHRVSDQGRDPFFWLDSRNAVILVDELTRLLMKIDAPRAHLYLRNRESVLKRVAEIDRVLEYGYRGLKGRPALLYYDTLQYFEQAYAFKVNRVLAPAPGEAVDTMQLLLARQELADDLYGCILVEAGEPATDLQLLTAGRDVPIRELDSMGSRFPAGPDLYYRMMEYNTRIISDCVGEQAAIRLTAETTSSESAATMNPRFLLIDHDGGLVTEADLRGHYSLIYFGYTFCPDICPTSLQVISQALDGIGDLAKKITPYFITIDPERDKVDVMRNYVKYFNEQLVGLTGSPMMIRRVAGQFGVKYEKVIEPGGDPDLYIMDHSASVVLLGPDGEFLSKFAHGISAVDMAEKLREYLQ